jgi:hypothetical protein
VLDQHDTGDDRSSWKMPDKGRMSCGNAQRERARAHVGRHR